MCSIKVYKMFTRVVFVNDSSEQENVLINVKYI